MNEPRKRTCTDCNGEMGEIKLIDKGEAGAAQEVEYAVIESTRSFWTGRVPIAGTVRGFMCSECGLIKHYGVPKT